MSLEDYGWCAIFSEAFIKYEEQGLLAGRVTAVHRGSCLIHNGTTEVRTQTFRHLEVPAVGDWVAWRVNEFGSVIVEAVLPRKSILKRKAAGLKTEAQIIAANIDTAFLVMGLDGDFNLRRIERLLTMTYESNAVPVLVLNKADVARNAEEHRLAAEAAAPGAAVLVVSARTGAGMPELQAFLKKGQTAVLIGSSGAGKSTIINRLFGRELMRTREIRNTDGRGRHTTTHRQLLKHPQGGLLIDSPGIREIQLWASSSALGDSFEEIVRLARSCRFRDCSHTTEPGCAVIGAVEAGHLSQARLAGYHKLRRELKYLELKLDGAAQREQKRRWKAIHKAFRKNKQW